MNLREAIELGNVVINVGLYTEDALIAAFKMEVTSFTIGSDGDAELLGENGTLVIENINVEFDELEECYVVKCSNSNITAYIEVKEG